MRRWEAGYNGTASGISYRVVQGRKSADDLRLEFRVNGEWRPVAMDIGFLLADFFFENEHVLYPRSQGYRGGWKYIQALQRAALDGWEAALSDLDQEKDSKRYPLA